MLERVLMRIDHINHLLTIFITAPAGNIDVIKSLPIFLHQTVR